ncbi:MAG: hypothetical protein JWN46_579 [Acidimicrobiales bacterium]|nr:hypothetical protein [Acidimicrobiales bacterium]
MQRYRVEGKSPLGDFDVVADKFDIKEGTVVFTRRPFQEDITVAAVPIVQLLSIRTIGEVDDHDQAYAPVSNAPFT